MSMTAGLKSPPSDPFTDEPTPGNYRAALAAICVYTVAAFAILPFGTVPIGEIPGLTPIFSTLVVTTDVFSGFLLLTMFAETRRPSLLILGCSYLFGGSMALFNIVTFPGVLRLNGGIFGNLQSSAWAILSWWIGYASLTLLAVTVECWQPTRLVDQSKVRPVLWLSLAMLLAAISVVALMITRFIDLMPLLIAGSIFTPEAVYIRGVSVGTMLITLALGLLMAGRRSRIFLWLSLALTASLCVNVLTLTSGGRNTLGWSLGRASWVVSASVLFLFFMGQFASQLRLLTRIKTALEHRVQERTSDLTQSLQQRDLLLREVYHRVKNNMQVIDSMLFLERRRMTDPTALTMIDALRNRVLALGLVHQQLMSSKNLEDFDIAPFLHELLNNLGQSEGVDDRGITLAVEARSILVNLDVAIPIGLLTTELVTNSIKHAAARHITVAFHRPHANYASLIVADDGPDPEAEEINPTSSVTYVNGQGSRIVAGLVGQLDGHLEITQDSGTRVEIVLPLPERG